LEKYLTFVDLRDPIDLSRPCPICRQEIEIASNPIFYLSPMKYSDLGSATL